jgi:hypothetical protein
MRSQWRMGTKGLSGGCRVAMQSASRAVVGVDRWNGAHWEEGRRQHDKIERHLEACAEWWQLLLPVILSPISRMIGIKRTGRNKEGRSSMSTRRV